MLKQSLLLAAFIASLSARAEVMEIYSSNDTVVKFTNGRTGFWKENVSPKMRKLVTEHTQVDVVIDENNEISSIRPMILNLFTSMQVDDNEALVPPQSLEATVLPSYASARALLDTFKTKPLPAAECYDRAHVWAYDSYYNSNVQLGKAFLFFADHYIEKYRFKWWFHVAPVVKLTMQGALVERIMDRTFSTAPLQQKIWTDIFMKNKVECAEVNLYTDYSEHPNTNDCFVIKTNMYAWQPRDLEAYAQYGYEKTRFIDWEIRHAFLHAYGITK